MSEDFYERLRRLDIILAKDVPVDFRREVAPLLLEDASLVYFYDNLRNPSWLQPLRDAGQFSSPPAPVRDEREGTVYSPDWPPMRFLKRVASEAASQVHEILNSTGDTENDRVRWGLTEAALSLPPSMAVDWARRQIAYVVSTDRMLSLLLPGKLGALAQHLASGGELDAAFGLIQALLEIREPRETSQEERERRGLLWSPEPGIRCDVRHYERILKEHWPSLVTADGMRALPLVCALLEKAILYSQRPEDHGSGDPEEDHSYIWYSAIEHGGHHNLKDILVQAVRDSAQAVLGTDEERVLDDLENRRFKVFRRIALYLRGESRDAARLNAVQAVTGAFDDIGLHHEYYHFLKKQFAILPSEARSAYLDMVAGGPQDVMSWRKFHEEELHETVSDDDVEKYRLRWCYKKLLPIASHLSGEGEERFAALAAEFEEPAHPDYHHYTEVRRGPTSPVKDEDLAGMPVAELVKYLQEFKPSTDGFGEPSREGLSRTLTAVVASEPAKYAEDSSAFEVLDPTYVRGVLRGFEEATKNDRAFDWEPVLRLCVFVVDTSLEPPARTGDRSEGDADWGWTRKTVGDLLSAGLKGGSKAPIPFGLRKQAWSAIVPLTTDPDPSTEREETSGGVLREPINIAINSVRGQAIECVVEYGLWVRRGLVESKKSGDESTRNFDEQPEVRRVLEEHLDPAIDGSLAIRAVYGQYFPWLLILDEKWAADHADAIFPLSEEARGFWWASWGTYVVFCQPYNNVAAILTKQYGQAIELMGTWPESEGRMEDPDRRLAEHLVVLYWRDRPGFSDMLLEDLYARASVELKAHVVEFIGRSLNEAGEEVPDQVLDRSKELWERRVADAVSTGGEAVAELTAFGWWLSSQKFDSKWAYDQFTKVLETAGHVDPDFVVVEGLAKMAADTPRDAVSCLKMLVERASGGSYAFGDEEETRTILGTAIQSGDEDARKIAIATINRLGQLGFLGYRDLLSDE